MRVIDDGDEPSFVIIDEDLEVIDEPTLLSRTSTLSCPVLCVCVLLNWTAGLTYGLTMTTLVLFGSRGTQMVVDSA